MSVLDQQVPEALPAPGVWHSFNGKIFLGEFEIFRITEAMFLISNSAGLYYEVGSRYPVPFRGQTMVSYSIRRAFVNLYEFVLALGQVPTINFVPGVEYAGADLVGTNSPLTLIDNHLVSNSLGGSVGLGSPADRPHNHYPIKTKGKFVVNPDGVHSENVKNGNPDYTKAYQQELELFGLMIDVLQLNIGAGGEIITVNPIEGIAEDSKMEIVSVSIGEGAGGGIIA